MEKEIIRLTNVVARLPEFRFAQPVNWIIRQGEQWAIIGPNGAGKTILANLLQRKLALKEGEIRLNTEQPAYEAIKSIAFKDIYSLADCKNTYYQQRWHSTETESLPTVASLLEYDPESEQIREWLSLFGIRPLLGKKLIFLSSGELRKFLIFRTLLTRPRILILDNPFIGLDAASRDVLVDLLNKLSRLHEVQTILLLSNPADIPEMVTHVLPVCHLSCLPPMSRQDFLQAEDLLQALFPPLQPDQLPDLPTSDSCPPSAHRITFRMEHVCIRYGEREILHDIDWEVRNGEKWSLSGPNGAGKSTLLSLIYADNPQSYANSILLFDRKRGSGESIWEIKKRIGYVSPEMHLYYQENVPALQVVGSGFFDSVGLYRKCNTEQETAALRWMEVFRIGHLQERSFLSLSSGEQRLVLLARAFVKNPDLLILDEPLHGLDICHKQLAATVIGKFCSQPGKTLIYVTHYPKELPACINRHFRLERKA